jgi:hypothetical protein
MKTKHLPMKTLVAGILSIAIGGCGNSGGNGASNGGTTSPAGGSSVTASGGSSSPASTTALGGTTSNGGSTVQVGTGGAPGNGGTAASGGSPGSGGAKVGTGGTSTVGSGGSSTVGSGGTVASGGVVGSGGANTGGTTGPTGGARTGGTPGTGGRGTGGASGGGALGSGGNTGTGGRTSTGSGSGTCTASKAASVNATGSGSHKVVVESNSDSGISCGTIYRPADLGGDEKYPIFVWGEGACTRSGTSNTASMAEIASHGYFVVADGPPSSGGSCGSIAMSTDVVGMAKPLISYIDWAIAENGKSCSAYYQSLDTTKIAADGFSCGGLMAEGTAGDSRMTAWGITSSGMTSKVASFYKTIHTPVKILLGGSDDIAYANGESDYDEISALGIPIILLSKTGAGHGGDLNNGKGDFNSVNLAWLNWQLKGDVGATGKGALVGSSCKYCTNSAWEVKSKNLP